MEDYKRKPCRECKAAKTKYNEYEIYTEEEIKEIFILLDEHAPLRNRVMIKFAFTGGFRRGELLAIDETDLFLILMKSELMSLYNIQRREVIGLKILKVTLSVKLRCRLM